VLLGLALGGEAVAGPEGVPAGALLAPRFDFELAVYHTPRPKKDPHKLLVRSLAGQKDLVLGRWRADGLPTRATVDLATMPTALYPPLSAESLKYFGRGLSEAQKSDLAASKQVTVLKFMGPGARALTAYRRALSLAAGLARESGGLLWDEEARLIFSPEAWAQRMEGWTDDGLPRVSQHVSIHAYRDGELIRMITVGMQKFALPDLVVNQVASSGDSMESVINLLAQRLVEGALVETGGRLSLSFDQIRHPGVRESTRTMTNATARRQAVLSLAVAKRERGDAENRLLEIVFPGPAASLQERHVALLVQLFGSEQDIVFTRHDDELMAASERGRRKALALKSRFAKAPPLNERLTVKAPFKTTSGGNEWMWVEVVRWADKKIDGVLLNQPDDVPSLKPGARVVVDEETIFDYTHYKADGSKDGNETTAIIQRRH
jgi:uncharacterized protein YegJ (DUF2314 family)